MTQDQIGFLTSHPELSIRDVANKLGLSYLEVRYWARKNKHTSSVRVPWTAEQMETLNRLAGRSVSEIAEATGRSVRAVEYKLRALGMQCHGLRHRGAYAPKPKAVKRKVVVTRGVYYCTCGAPVSDYVAHRERMGCVPPWLRGRAA